MNTKQRLINKLSSIMPINEAISEIDFILKEQFSIEKTKLILYPDLIDQYADKIESIINERIETRKPLQYILNKAVFLNETYFVDENVLIPRPETELLVLEATKHLNSKAKLLEIGTGSGCIAISLAKILKNNNITTCDISQNALNVAQINAKAIAPEYAIKFINSDLFSNVNEKFDAIISNPPYISEDFKKEMQPEVLKYEPHTALFAENEGMLIYEKIIEQAPKFLNIGGLIAFEAGINQADKIKNLLETNGFTKVIIITDLSSIDRIVLAWYN